MPDRKRSKVEERRYADLDLALMELELSHRHRRRKAEFIPADWHRIEREVPVRPKKTRVTAAFDAEVVKWFRAMGHGDQARMNAVLRTYMLAMVSKEIRARADLDWKGEPI
jgi:uncharacterized protein (DUF4415 family)